MTIDEVIAAHAPDRGRKPGELLATLHAVQSELGCLPRDVLDRVAAHCNLSRAEVHGVMSFYPDFRTSPGGRHVIQICRAEACQAMGAAALERYVRALLQVDYGETTADGSISLQPVYCLGNCACAPSVRIGDRVHGRVDAARLERLVANVRQGEGE